MSNNIVKNFSVGKINMDLPFNQFIHELPLISFGDLKNKLNLSLIYYSYNINDNNSFNIKSGFKLNLQKRLIIENNLPTKYQDEYGRTIDLVEQSGLYSFDDTSMRFMKWISYEESTPTGNIQRKLYIVQNYD